MMLIKNKSHDEGKLREQSRPRSIAFPQDGSSSNIAPTNRKNTVIAGDYAIGNPKAGERSAKIVTQQ